MTKLFFYVFYLLVLINPISKIFILSVLAKEFRPEEMRLLVRKSSLFAALILLALGAGGDFILTKIFHVQLYSLKTAAGIILFFVGYNALSKGIFFEVDEKQKMEDISLVPLASPMIAGPAAITAAISMNSELGLPTASLCIAMAVLVNWLVMTSYRWVSDWMIKYHLMGALIRITGLIVAAISVEMVFEGIGEWWRGLSR
jgi:multiple antibiotic resistance protein